MPSGINKMAYRISFEQRLIINIVKIGFIKAHMLARSYKSANSKKRLFFSWPTIMIDLGGEP